MLIVVPLLLGFSGAASGDGLCQLRIIVHEAVQGRAVKDRPVYFLSDVDGSVTTSRTDAVGAAVLENLTCGPGRVGLGFTLQTSSGFAGLRLDEPVLLSPGSNPEVRLVVPELVEVRVVAHSLSDGPVAGVSVAFRPTSTLGGPSDPFPVVTSTDDAGVVRVTLVANHAYVVRGVAGVLGRIVRIAVDGREVQNAQEVYIGSGHSDLEIVIEAESMLRGVVRMEGSVDGPQTVLDLSPADAKTCFGCVVVKASGEFSFGVASLPVRVRPRELHGNWDYEPREIEVTRENADTLLAFSARRRDGDDVVFHLKGFESHSSGTGAYAIVKWNCEGETGALRRELDGAGSFRAPCLEQCPYQVNVPRFGRFRTTNWTGTTATCPAEFDVTLRTGSSIKGRVTNEVGEGLSGVVLLARRGTESESAVTDDAGDFVIEGLSAGVFEIELGKRKSKKFDAYAVLVDEAGKIPKLEAVEDPERAKEGRLQVVRGGEVCARLNDSDGSPLKYSTLRVDHEEATADSSVKRVPYGGASDRICVGGLPSGDYQIRVGDAKDKLVPVWYPGEFLQDMAGWVDVEAGKTVDVGPLLTYRTGSVRMKVSDSDRDLLSNMSVFAACSEKDGLLAGSSGCIEVPMEDDSLRSSSAELVELAGVPVGGWFLFLCVRESGCRAEYFATIESVVVPGGDAVDVMKVAAE